MSENHSTLSRPLCGCGCGKPVRLARNGKPNRFQQGHFHRGRPKSAEHKTKLSRAKMGTPGPWLGKKMPASARAKMSAAKIGVKLTKEHRAKIAASLQGKPCPSRGRPGHKQSLSTKRKRSLAQKGHKGSNWKGGITKANRVARASAAFRDWRKAVFERDNYTCQHCESHTGGGHRVTLHPHHIKPFATHYDVRFKASNGITLCKPCHDLVHGRVSR